MNSHKISIRFVVAKNRKRKDNRIPIYVRLTYNNLRKQFSTGLFISPIHWNSKQQLVKPPEPDSDLINSQLSLIKTKINRAFLMLQVKEESFNVEDVYGLYKGVKTAKEYTIIAEFFDRYLKKLKTLVGIDIKLVTWNKFYYIKKDVKSFIKW